MLLTNEFEIDTDLDSAWALLTDLERIMPCMPGAALEGRDGDNYLGSVKVKVGPIGAYFTGTAHFAERDDDAHSAVIAAAGKDPKGQAAASASIRARLEPLTSTKTRVLIDTDLDISGRMAQFGRGAIADVSNRLIGQFVSNISTLLVAPGIGSAPAIPAEMTSQSRAYVDSPAATGSQRSPFQVISPAVQPSSEEASMNVLSLLIPVVKERYGQAIAGGLLGFALSWLVFGRKANR